MVKREREIWTIDIDDVSLRYGGAFANFSNRAGWTRGLTAKGYNEQWGELWGGADVDEIARRASVLNRGMAPFLRPVRDAPLALAALAQARDLIAFTSRPRSLHTTTVASLGQHFPDTFRDIKYLDGGWGDRGAIESVTKGEAAVRLGASTHIDDQVRHAVGMAGAGGVGLLFGDSHAAATATVGDGVVRVPTWRDVLRHADIDPASVFSEN